MIDKNFINKLHQLSLKYYGGLSGIRDEGLLESAIARPFQTFGGEGLYPSPVEKAAAIAESIVLNHPYLDGNKRTGFLAMFSMVEIYNLQITASESEAHETMIQVSTGALNYEGLVAWLELHVAPAASTT